MLNGTDIKSGLKSTEFWMIVVVLLLVALGPTIGLDLDKEQIKDLLILSGIYTGGRAVPKAVASLGRK